MSGRLPAGSGRAVPPSWPVALARQRVGAAQRRVGEAVPQRDDAAGVEQAAAGVGIDRGEDGAGGDVLAVAGDVAGDVAAEDVVAVARLKRAGDVGAVAGGRHVLPATMLLANSSTPCRALLLSIGVVPRDGAVADYK